MRPLFVIGAIGLGLFGLFVLFGGGSDAPRLLVLGGWLALLVVGLLASGERVGAMVRDLAIWGVIFLAVTSLYVFRYDFQEFGQRLRAGVLPGAPVAFTDGEGRASVTLVRSRSGHFEADTSVNGRPARFLIDTGASGIVLSHRTAAEVGLPVGDLRYDQVSQTANGLSRSARTRLDSLRLGGIERLNVPVTVAAPGALGGTNLLGQTFLESLDAYERRGDRLTLVD